MSQGTRERVLQSIRQSLNRVPGSPIAPRPPVVPPRVRGDLRAEVDQLVNEINAIKGEARSMAAGSLPDALSELVRTENIKKAVLWNTPGLASLQIAGQLAALGVELIPHDAGKRTMAQADLGVTEADFALPETGTLGLLSSPDKPRMVSLLPRVHLAIVSPHALRADLHQVFAEASSHDYLVLVTGPSRTSDIELVVTIGVHGPQKLYAWIVDEI